MRVARFLDTTWYHNSVREWITAGLILVVGFALLAIVRRTIAGRLREPAARTPSHLDDLAVDLVRRTTNVFLFLLCLEAASRALQIPERLDRVADKVLVAVTLFQIAVWGNGIINFWLRRHVDRRRAAADAASATTIGALGYAAKIALWMVIVVSALENLGLNITALVTGLGIGGIAIALAVQNVLGDLLAALAIVMDKPFDVGDFIVVDVLQGTVEHVGLKTTRLRSLGGEQIVISNSELLKGRIRNFKRMVERRVVFTTDVAYETHVDVLARIPATLREIVSANRPVRFERSHFMAYTESALRVETVYYVLDPDYNRYMDIQQQVNLEILRRFRAEGIDFAYPSRPVVYLEEKGGGAGLAT
jgi:small-conductance mechanosensitive channel